MTKPNFSIEGKIALVTGAKRAIGREIAITFAECGADVAVCSRNIDDGELDSVVKDIRKLGRRAIAVQADVSKKADVDNMVKKVLGEFGRIDILVNNAAVIVKSYLLDYKEEDFDQVMDIDLKGTFLCSQAVGKIMVQQGKGAIVNIAAGAATRPPVRSGPYATAKAGMVMLTKSFARELGPSGIRVNAVSPGMAKTEMTKWLWGSTPTAMDEYAAKVPLKRITYASDVAAATVFLSSEAASYISGVQLDVDGGMGQVTP
jgi:3-oxoacyl-[acyl-carrier protein] reductase